MQRSILSITLLLVVLVTGCTTPQYTLYRSNSPNTPLIEKMGDFHINGSMSPVGAWNARAAVSPIPHILFMGNIMSSTLRNLDHDSTIPRTHNYEYGGGLYHTFYKEDKSDNRWTAVLLGGYGNGYMFYDYKETIGLIFGPYTNSAQILNNTYTKKFIQLCADEHSDNGNASSCFIKLSHLNCIVDATRDPGQLSKIPEGTTHYVFNTIEMGISGRNAVSKYFSVFVEFGIFFPVGRQSTNYYTLVTNSGSSIAQKYFNMSMGISFSEQNLVNIFHRGK